ncbi:hypothetical protein CPB83DRAFT_910561 [Crepidotus variabilis]|uniref:Transmembrane protein n=1 Tax=Crepidotus variabilis TaxID=179855 RepID=A0A9P6JJQ8_9AGAR|nr:hypothetical protein CPB83DRAFT_839608 [Crepidotus variabilis]KAF9523517.1 hypothetical protein CPB83DRAFT_910561 [Crepidotus variabilis]
MSSFSIGTYSGGTAFVGLGSFFPTDISPFHIAIGGTAVQQVSIASTVVGAGFGAYATYAGFFDASVHARRRTKIVKGQFYNATVAGVQEDVGVHWMDFPAGYFPTNVLAHVDDGHASILLSAFDSGNGECVAEMPLVKWMDYPAGYFPLNIPIFDDNGNESVVQLALHPEATTCAPGDAPVPIKWLEYATEYVPTTMDLFVDDEVPFGFATSLACPFDSEKIERVFVTLRNPPTRTQFKPTPVLATIDTRTRSAQFLTTALLTVICIVFGTMRLIVTGHGLKMIENNDCVLDVTVNNKPSSIDLKAEEPANKKAASYKSRTPASLVSGGRRRTKKPKKSKKPKKPSKPKPFSKWLNKFSIVIGPGLEAVD